LNSTTPIHRWLIDRACGSVPASWCILRTSAAILKASEQLRVARFPAHYRLIHAMIPISSVEAWPRFHEARSDLFLSFEAIFLRPGLVITRRGALIGDALADLFDIYDGNAVGPQYHASPDVGKFVRTLRMGDKAPNRGSLHEPRASTPPVIRPQVACVCCSSTERGCWYGPVQAAPERPSAISAIETPLNRI
jgi:hypothetical protein